MSNQNNPPDDKNSAKSNQVCDPIWLLLDFSTLSRWYIIFQSQPGASNYLGIPKVEAVATYVQSAYVWFKGFTEAKVDNSVPVNSPNGQKIAPHPGGTVNIIPTDKNKMTPDGEKLSMEVIKSDGKNISAEKIEDPKNSPKLTPATSPGQPGADIVDSADLNSRGSANIQFSFLDQLRELEDSKNVSRLIPVYLCLIIVYSEGLCCSWQGLLWWKR